ncbi:hypothetical protein BH20ACI1_BH20ACI1_16790 [soil metagenome]
MKYCPKCKRIYSENTVKFCRVDGISLVDGTFELSSTLPLPALQKTDDLPTRLLATTHSIAVLPFTNMTDDAKNEYFCDGLAEELLNALAKIDELKVVARTSAFSFKDKNINVSEIGKILNVNTILEGSVRRMDKRLRVTVQLINATNGFFLWSERYDREVKDVFDVQDEITLAVVDALKVKLLGKKKSTILKRYTDNMEVYEFYLKGRFYYNKYTVRSWRKAVEYFEKAIEIEPRYAPAYAGIAMCYGALWYFGVSPPHEIVPKWKAAANRALEIDKDLAEGHFTLASILFFYDWKWQEAEKEIQRAIVLNPNSVNAYWRYGMFLASREQFDEAIEYGRQAVELDPLSLMAKFFLEWMYWYAGRFDDALEQINKMIEIEPKFPLAYWQIGNIFVAKGMYKEAVEVYQKSLTLGNNPIVLSFLGVTYGTIGQRNEALEVLNELFEIKKRRYVPAINIARVYSGLGETGKTFEWLEKAVEERNGELVYLNVETKVGTGDVWGKKIRQDSQLLNIISIVGNKIVGSSK